MEEERIRSICLSFGRRTRWLGVSRRTTRLLLIVLNAAALVSLLGHLYGVPEPFLFARSAPLWLSAGLLASCSALLALRPEDGWVVILADEGATGAIARRLLPPAVLVPILLGTAKVGGIRSGWSGAGLGPVMVAALVVLFVVLTRAAAASVLEQERARRAAERELEQARAQLADMLSQKAVELERTTAQLIQAQKMEAVGRLAGGVAHDFNNLLSAILGFAELLGRSLDAKDPRREDVDEISHAAERAAALTRQLLAFSRKQIMEPRNFELNALIADAQKMLSRLIGEDVSFAFRPGDGVGSVYADPTQLEQVLMNLVVNARDAMPRGGALTVSTDKRAVDAAWAAARQGAKPGDYAIFEVRDTGTGMTEEVMAHLFEPFFTTKAPGKGTGLGLSTVFGIVKQSGGWIDVDSKPGVGTAFRVYVPVSRAPDERAAGEGRASDGALSGTILLVDDDEQVRRVVARQLSAAGLRIIEAAGPEPALAVAQSSGKIDLLLTDVRMPGMDGFELAARLKKGGLVSRAVFMTGYAGEPAAGRDGEILLQKPVRLSELLKTLRRELVRPA